MTILSASVLAMLVAAPPARPDLLSAVRAGEDLYATFETSLGTFVCRLMSKQAPDAVGSFVGYATGQRSWSNLRRTLTLSGRPLFDGTWIYRSVPGFVIQGGDPFNTGMMPLAFPFEDPVTEGGTFNEAGALATVGTGPQPLGSEFFVTATPASWLNGRHTVFGEVIAGMEVVDAISRVPVGVFNRPLKPVIVEHVRITREAPAMPDRTRPSRAGLSTKGTAPSAP